MNEERKEENMIIIGTPNLSHLSQSDKKRVCRRSSNSEMISVCSELE